MAHGAGGKATQGLIEGLLVPAFGGERSRRWATPGAFEVDGAQLAMTTDSFVVRPLRFPGGSIGELAVNGTVNDLAVAGARPLALTLSLVLEEGLAADDLRAEVDAIAGAARAAGAQILAGDTKVVERGHADGMYICTAGVGRRDPRARAEPLRGAPWRPHPALRIRRRARHRDHARSRRVRARRRRCAPTPARCGPRPTRCWTRPGRRSTACATRRAAEWRPSATSWLARRASRCSCARPRCR